MPTLGFYYDQNKCMGCKSCQIACKDRNNLDLGINFRTVSSYQSGSFPDARIYHYSATCNHCEDPACVANCPTGAMQKDRDGDGTVQHDDELCIGCSTCVKTCPYSVPRLLADKGISGKCDACKPFRAAGKNPVCVDACIMRCLHFGDVDELVQTYGEAVDELPILPGAENTTPSTRIKAKEAALDPAFEMVIL